MKLRLWLYWLKRPFHWLKTGLMQALPTSFKYGQPFKELKVIVVTGTDGKSTTANLIHQMLSAGNISAGLLTTVSASVGKDNLETGLHVTSPQPKFLQQFGRRCLDAGCTYLVLEVTSHGFYQYRTWGIQPEIATLTNVTHEHLDYHFDLAHYAQAKAGLLNSADKIILASNTPGLDLLQPYLDQHKIVTFRPDQSISPTVEKVIQTKFNQEFNRANARLAAQVATAAGVAPSSISKAIANYQNLPGRMEEISTNQKFKVIIDFAHTPYALESALKSLRPLVKAGGKLVAVYGSAGERDFSKRPLMGEVGSRLADLAILTTEDPRTENVWSIIRQMKEQLKSNHRKIISIADRGQAISYAIARANPGDVIGVFGKGHEQSMCFGRRELPWSDKVVVEQALKAKEGMK